MPVDYIGYYPTLSRNPQVVQGEYIEVLNDPLYVRDMMQMIIPISDNSIYKKNKPYDQLPDLLTADEGAYLIKDIYGQEFGYETNKEKDNYYGKGLSLAGSGNIFRKTAHISEHVLDKVVPDSIKKDIRKGYSDVKKYVKKKKLSKKRKLINRPLAKEIFKMENKKPSYPGQKLKKRLLTNKNMKHPNKYRKRTQIKNLLDRLR